MLFYPVFCNIQFYYIFAGFNKSVITLILYSIPYNGLTLQQPICFHLQLRISGWDADKITRFLSYISCVMSIWFFFNIKNASNIGVFLLWDRVSLFQILRYFALAPTLRFSDNIYLHSYVSESNQLQEMPNLRPQILHKLRLII